MTNIEEVSKLLNDTMDRAELMEVGVVSIGYRRNKKFYDVTITERLSNESKES